MRIELGHVHADVASGRIATDGAHAQFVNVASEVAQLRKEVTALAAAIQRAEARLDDDVLALLRVLVADEAGNRRRLEDLRATPDYERPFDDPAPLVSICIPALASRMELLLERALPSALGQTHAHIEVVIVGDGHDPRVDPRLATLSDSRVRLGDVTHRISGTRYGQWFAGSTLPRQEARRLARGLWITDLDDDDALREDAIEKLLAHARATRAEVTSGLIEQHHPDGTRPHHIAGFPASTMPDWSGLPADWAGRACTAALWHHGLRFFVRVHAAELIGVPDDVYLALRMARAGVRFAQLDEPVYDYWPGALWDPLHPNRA
jgi:hypothetical protein